MNCNHSVVRVARAGIPLLMAASLMAGCGSAIKDIESNWSPDKLYSEARAEADAGAYERAAKLYERLEGRASGTVLAQQAQLERLRAVPPEREGAGAVGAGAVHQAASHQPAVDYALYLQGIVNFNDNSRHLGSLSRQDLSERDQQASRDAYQAFKAARRPVPAVALCRRRALRMNHPQLARAAYEVHVARYYFRRGAYRAAANRAQQTVQEFQQSPSTEEALFIMASSYDRLGLTQLRDDASRVLTQNFPNSAYIGAEGLTEKPRSWWQLW
jgi:outer membrane protein assembly factor BamD